MATAPESWGVSSDDRDPKLARGKILSNGHLLQNFWSRMLAIWPSGGQITLNNSLHSVIPTTVTFHPNMEQSNGVTAPPSEENTIYGESC